MKILFLHGLEGGPGGTKASYLRSLNHDVVDPLLPRDDFPGSVAIARTALGVFKPDMVVGSSRGGAVAVALVEHTGPMVLIAPAWKHYAIAPRVTPATVVVHAPADDIVPFADSLDLLRAAPASTACLKPIGDDHRLSDANALAGIGAAIILADWVARRPAVDGAAGTP